MEGQHFINAVWCEQSSVWEEERRINVFLSEKPIWLMFEEWYIRSEWVESEPKEWKTVEEM